MTATVNAWSTRRTLVREETDPQGRTWTATDDVTYAGDHLMVPDITEAATETRDARARFFSLIDACAATYGGEVARDLEDAAVDVEVAIRIEVIARLLGVATALEPDYGMFITAPGAASTAAAAPSPPPEWALRWRGRRVLVGLATAFATGLAVRSLMGRLV